MSWGYEQWDSAGRKTLSITDRTPGIAGVYSGYLAANATSALIVVPDWVNSSSWVVSTYANQTPSAVMHTRYANGFTVTNQSGDYSGGAIPITWYAVVWRT